MAKIDWAVICDAAFLDRQDRLCIIGIVRDLQARVLPLWLRQVTLVAHLTDILPLDEIDVAVGMVTPSGQHTGRPGAPNVTIEMARDYVLATMRDLALTEEGVHHFQVRLRGQPMVAIDVPVWTTMTAVSAGVQ
jgi:hypothetical protein